MATNSRGEVTFHSMHEEGKTFDHTNDLYQSILLLTGVVVTGGLQQRQVHMIVCTHIPDYMKR